MRDAGRGHRVGDPVVHGVHECDAVTERSQSFPRDAEGVGVTVEADEAGAREAPEEGFGVSPHTQSGIDEDSTVARERRSEQLGAALEQNRGVNVAGFHDEETSPIFDPDPHPLRPGAGEVRQGKRLGVTAEDQNKPGITSCSISAYDSSLLSA